MNFSAIVNRGLLCIALGVTLVACDDNNDNNKENRYLPISTPTVELPPEVGSPVLPTVNFDLGDQGYRQQEYFLSGSSQAFTNLNELLSDGMWQVEPGDIAPYKTRILVYRPIDAADFSGTVLLEWLNVTAGAELAPSWNAGHTGILRAGHAWIGVSAQIEGIEGNASSLLPSLKEADPERYGSLQHPGDSFSYDIFSQAAQAVREPDDLDVLDGLQLDQILAFGESQSAGRMVTYINALHPLYNTFDGYMVHSRGGRSAALSEEPQTPIPAPDVVTVRTDTNVPVMNFQTETDLFYLGFINSRQDDNDTFRLWEVAGTAHADYYMTVSGFDDQGTDPAFAVVVEDNQVAGGLLTCDKPLNNGPQPWVFNAAIDALVRWTGEGIAPATAERLLVTDDLSTYQYDELGNVLGGIRTSYTDTPAAILSGEGQLGSNRFCFLFGTTELLDAATMASLYIDKAGYIQAVSDATNDAIDKGFLLPPDGERIKAAASLQWDMLDI